MDKHAIARRIVHHRKLKGVTQETLAELTGLNVRTVQRIEAGEVDPRLYTLKAIAEALEVNMEELLPEPTQHERNQIAILHLTPLGFFLFPIMGNILFPFIFWMMKKEEINGINKHGKDILNGQITYSIVGAFFMIAFFVILFIGPWIFHTQFGQFFTTGFWFIFLTGSCLSFVFFGLFPLVNTLRVYRGGDAWRYPLKIQFFK